MRLFACLWILLICHSAFAEQFVESPSLVPKVELDVPVIDYPINFSEGDYVFPSMRQSLALSTDFYQAAHAAIAHDQSEHQVWRIIGLIGFDIFTSWTPLSSSWLHEEWHRSMLSRRGYASYDDINNFPLFSNLISVSHVSDQDLIALKRDFPAEQVRLSSAGMEAQVYQNMYFDKSHFFNGARTHDDLAQLLNAISVTGYLQTCASTDSDTETNSQNSKDGTNIMKRDFTGLDCDGWVYDLFRADEPYTNRGVHPSGVGVNRYIKYSDLTPHEQRFLRRQVVLSLVNFADPMLWRQQQFHGRAFHHDIWWNATASHYLTSFGYTVDANVFYKTVDETTKLLLTLHSGFNAASYFPGLSVDWLDHKLSDKFSITNSATLWPQPKNQRIGEHQNELLASIGTEISYRLAERTKIYVGLRGKTAGWQAGEENIEKSWNVTTGFRQTVF